MQIYIRKSRESGKKVIHICANVFEDDAMKRLRLRTGIFLYEGQMNDV